jgi:hypothetical protein
MYQLGQRLQSISIVKPIQIHLDSGSMSTEIRDAILETFRSDLLLFVDAEMEITPGSIEGKIVSRGQAFLPIASTLGEIHPAVLAEDPPSAGARGQLHGGGFD